MSTSVSCLRHFRRYFEHSKITNRGFVGKIFANPMEELRLSETNLFFKKHVESQFSGSKRDCEEIPLINPKALFCGVPSRENAKIIQREAPKVLPRPEPKEGFGGVIPMSTLAVLTAKAWKPPLGMSPEVTNY